MPLSRSVLSILLSTLISVSLFAQQTSTRASAMLQQALLTLSPSVSISDVTLSGSARRIAGSDDETGTVTLEAMAGRSRESDVTDGHTWTESKQCLLEHGGSPRTCLLSKERDRYQRGQKNR